MARDFARQCPKCREHFFCVVISHPTPQSSVFPVTACCAVCGYRLRDWRLILGRKRAPEIRYDRMPKVFR
jgi:C4-type Zn-finger protein